MCHNVKKYVEAIPQQNLVSFLEGACFPSIVFLPFGVLLISILSHVCSDSRKIIKYTYAELLIEAIKIKNFVECFYQIGFRRVVEIKQEI
jgi:hypothetical protein